MKKPKVKLAELKVSFLAFIKHIFSFFIKKKIVPEREYIPRNTHLIGSGHYCPDCGGLCGNDKHDRLW